MSIQPAKGYTNKMHTKKNKSEKNKTRILVVEEHSVFCEGLTAFINKEPGFEVCGEVTKAEKTIHQIKKLKPDLVIVDISNIGMSGLAIIKSIRENFREIPLLVLSMYEGSYLTKILMEAGANCCLDSLKASEELIGKIKGLIKK